MIDFLFAALVVVAIAFAMTGLILIGAHALGRPGDDEDRR